MKRALCIWLPHWPLQRLAAARAELSSHAVVLYQWHAGQSARVVEYAPHLATAAAAPWQYDQSTGIRPGMPLAEATALADRARDADQQPQPVALHLELADPLADRAALLALAEWCQQFSPSVGLEESETPSSLLLDVTGLGPLFEGELALAARVLRLLGERQLTARVAIADTQLAAWGLAHFAPLELDASADTASANTAAILGALAQPLIVPPGQTREALARLSIEALDLPADICALLAELGLRRIEQLAALPRASLGTRFGALVLEQLDRAHGLAAEALEAHPAPGELEFEWLFEHPTERAEMIELALGQLIGRACQALACERRGVLRFECRFECEGRASEAFVIGLYRASAAERHLSELARLKLESLRFREPVAAVRLTVLAIGRLEFRQQELWAGDDEDRRESPAALAALVDRLSSRLGPQAVLRPWLVAQAQPEFACHYRPLVTLKSNRRSAARTVAPAAGDRPLYLSSRPRRLSAVSVAPEGPPMQFHLDGEDRRIVRVWGPERIETGWWRTRCVRRDYYQVETARGERFWLFRELNSGQWFLHGEFA